MKQLEGMGIPRNRIIDGRVFEVPNLDFPRLLSEGIAYGVCEINSFDYSGESIYPRVIEVKNTEFSLKFGRQSFIGSFSIELGLFMDESITIGEFSSIANATKFELDINYHHNFRIVSQYDLTKLSWEPHHPIYVSRASRTEIGSDVWIGRRSVLKCTNSKKPLIIGDGAIIASDSVVVKNVPPYAIVGGNPAQIIKYRFPPHVVEALLRIKWWDWSLDKIHDNFKYFNDVEKFISLHDKED